MIVSGPSGIIITIAEILLALGAEIWKTKKEEERIQKEREAEQNAKTKKKNTTAK